MTTQIACSVCHAAITPGATSCLGCGLPLVAQAAAVAVKPERKPFAPLWARVALALALVSLVAYSVEHGKQTPTQEAHAKPLIDLLSGGLATPATFQARCGRPTWTKQTREGTELHYRIGASDYYVTFAGSGPRFQSEQTDWSGKKPTVYRITIDSSTALNDIGCK